jgi:K+-sensing histidine kinase KdpD
MSEDSLEDYPELSVRWSDLVRFVRQLSHDLRNDLNAAELQAAFLGELAGENAELKKEVKRLREMISKLAANLQGVSSALGQINLHEIPYRVSEFVEDLREKLNKDFPDQSASVKWEVHLSEEMFEIDPQLLLGALLELFRNAFQHGGGKGEITVSAWIDNGIFGLTIREPKEGFDLPTEKWGREPLAKVRQGHYGLGLNRVRVILEAHGGNLGAHYESATSELVTRATVPITSAS